MAKHPRRSVILPVWTMRNGKEVRDGYDLLIYDTWHERYRLRREAVAAAATILAGMPERNADDYDAGDFNYVGSRHHY